MFFGPHVANFLDAPSSLVLLFSDLQRPPTCCSHAQYASSEFRLHKVLSTSGQHCLDLAPWEINFSMGPKLYRVTIFFGSHVPNFLEALSSLVLLFSDLQGRLHVLRVHRTPHQNLGSIAFFLPQINTVLI